MSVRQRSKHKLLAALSTEHVGTPRRRRFQLGSGREPEPRRRAEAV